MARSLKKGFFIDHHLLAKVESQNESGSKQVIRNLVPSLDGDSRHGGSHRCRAQRTEVHSGVRQREHGRPQAR